MANSSDPKALQERLQEVLADEAFARELLAMERPEDVQAALEERDVELSLDEIREIGETMRKVQGGEISQEQLQGLADGELSEDELEEVAGGLGTLAILLLIGLGAGAAYGGAMVGGFFGW